MNGTIDRIVEKRDKYQNVIKNYGFILGEDGQSYFFYKTALVNCTIYQIEEGDSVSFDKNLSYDSRLQATNIRKKASSIVSKTNYDTNPGINPHVNLDSFNDDERTIIKELSKDLYITNQGGNIKVNDSNYRYVLVKPTTFYHEMFKMDREIPIIFSDYVKFEPRSLDVASKVPSKLQSKLRLDRSCQILISNDSNIEQEISELLTDRNLDSIVIPFSYEEFLSHNITIEGIRDRFRKYLFDADLFSSSDPIENDVFFFGRRDLARDLANQCKRAANCGIFGLRRSGKTSMLLAVRRILENEGYCVILIPCQSDLRTLSWNDALYHIVKEIKSRKLEENSNYNTDGLHNESDYDESKAGIFFEEDLNILLGNDDIPTVLMFDEIENITFDIATSSELWQSGDNYFNFWNTIRGYRTKKPMQLSVVIAGTNPMIQEVSELKDGRDNPMFGQISSSNQGIYLRPFSVKNTEEMVNTLGGYMGLKFGDNIVASLTDDCGGHPYLIRMLCGYINKYVKTEKINRPVTISKAIYEKARDEFEKSADAEGYYIMILNILQTCYEKEFNTLKVLATQGDNVLRQTLDDTTVSHLLGYGLIEDNNGNFAIRFNTIERYLKDEYKFERENLTMDEQKEEISFRIDKAERKLRALVQNTLRISFGVKKAKEAILLAMENSKSVNYNNLNTAKNLEYKQLFDPTVNHAFYLSVLIEVILENFELFKNVFETDVDIVKNNLTILNKSRRISAHNAPEGAQNWSNEDFTQFRMAMNWLEDILKNYD